MAVTGKKIFGRAAALIVAVALCAGLSPAPASAAGAVMTSAAQASQALTVGKRTTLSGMVKRVEVTHSEFHGAPRCVFYVLELDSAASVAGSPCQSVDLGLAMSGDRTSRPTKSFSQIKDKKLQKYVGKHVSASGVLTEASGTFVYSRALLKSLSVKAQRLSLSKATVTDVSSAAYTGKAIKPNPTVKLGSRTLKKGADYTVSYTNSKGKKATPKKVGSYKVVIKGKGNYKGTVKKAFKITPKVAYQSSEFKNYGASITAKAGGATFKATARTSATTSRYTSTVYTITMTKGGKTTTVATNTSWQFATNGRILYYAERGAKVSNSDDMADMWDYRRHTIYRMDLQTGARTVMAQGVNIVPYGATDSYLYYGKYQSAASDEIYLYALAIKMRSSKFMGYGLNYVGICGNRVIASVFSNAGGAPLYSFAANGSGRKTITKSAWGAKVSGKKVVYVEQNTKTYKYRKMQCSSTGKGKKALTKWQNRYPSL